MADTTKNDHIDAGLVGIAHPCPDCGPDLRRLWRPTDRAIDALAALLLALAERDLDAERREREGGGA